MVDQFTIGFRAQRWWGNLAAMDFFLGGTGGGAFLLSMYFGIPSGMVLGWIAVALGAVALLVDLGRPDRFLRAGSQISRSWISRGVVLTSIFLLFGLLRLAPEFIAGLPWGKDGGLGLGIGAVATLGALGVMMYTGFLLSQSPAIPFWNSTMLPLLFALYGFTCGAGAILLLLPAAGAGNLDLGTVEVVGISLTTASLVFLWVYLLNMSTSTVAAKESVRMLTSGDLALTFLLGVTLVGLVVPLVLMAVSYLAGAGPAALPALATAGILVLIGGYLFRYSMLKAGVYPPVIDL